MSDPNFSAIRARLRYETIEDFIQGYSRFISGGGMFIPMRPSNLKPIGTTIRFQFLLGDGATALLGEGVVLQVREPDASNPRSPVGMLVKFTKLSQDSKALVDRILQEKNEQLRGGGGDDPTATKNPTQPFMDPHEESEPDFASAPGGDTRESHRDIVNAAAQAAVKSNLTENDATPMPEEPSPELEPEAFAEAQTPEPELVPNRASIETPVSDVLGEDTAAKDDDTGVTENSVLDALLAEESEAALGEEPSQAEEAAVEAILAADLAAQSANDEPEEEEEDDFDFGFETPQAEMPTPPEEEEDEPEPLTAEAPDPMAEPPTAEALEPPTVEPATAEVSDDLILDDADLSLEEASEVKQPQQLGQTEGGLQILAFDDLSEDAMKELEDFSFAADEGDVDDMFDGLFGSSQAEDDFFSAFGGGSSEAASSFGPSDEGTSQSSVEFELPSDDELADVEPEAEPEPEPEPEPEEEEDILGDLLGDDLLDEPDAVEEPEPAPSDVSLEEAFSSPELDSQDEDSVIDAEDASFVFEEEPSEFDAQEPEAELGGGSSPVLVLADEADEEDILLDQALSFHGTVAEPEPEEEQNHELDNLLDHLDEAPEEPKELTLHLGSEASEEEEEEPEDEYADEESLEFLLASAKKEIEEKHPTDKPEGDIIDQMFGDDELPPPPTDSPSFDLPTPTEKRKKGFISKLFGKD